MTVEEQKGGIAPSSPKDTEADMKATLAAGLFATAVLGALPAPAPAQRSERVLVIYGNDPCPTNSSGEEIVVCARRPETERYRIPPNVREDGDNSPERQSWAVRARAVDAVTGPGTDAVESCSTVGQGGQTGCLKDIIADSQAGWNADEPVNTPQPQ
jgi:hypothetical protein